MSDHDPVFYKRALPGGGYVAVEGEDLAGSGQDPRAHLRVERRAQDERRDGHTPPVVATVQGATLEEGLAELYAIARDNVAVARTLLRWQATRGDRERES
ncbi:MAG TPA: hypothetical protein VFG84_03610 [Gemmatimonadaceae bacterium]|nr:hypothetical protein [Gemmatimonadaceae bacterium]